MSETCAVLLCYSESQSGIGSDLAERNRDMVATSHPRTKKEVVLRGSVSEIDLNAGAFMFQPIYGDKVRAIASKTLLGKLPALVEGSADERRVLIEGIGVYRRDELEYLTQVDDFSLLHSLDVPARLDEFRDMKDGWADGIQHPSDWGSGYGKAPSHEGLDWLADKFTSEYPDDLPLPRAYPTPEGGIQMEWRLGRYDISLEVDFESRIGEWNWVDLNSEDEGENALNMDDRNDWQWVAVELRRFIGGAN